MRRPVVVLTTGAAPYLGGPATWAPLRAAIPDVECREVDLLACEGRVDVARAMIDDALRDADAVVAHGAAALTVVESVAAQHDGVVVLLLSPLIVRDRLLTRAARAGFGFPPVAWLLRSVARAKHRRLLDDRSAVAAELAKLTRPEAISDALVDEARGRIADPRTALAVERTADVVRATLVARSRAGARVPAVVLVHDDTLGTPIAVPFDAPRPRVVAASAPMLEDPVAVANALRDLLAAPPRGHAVQV